MKLYLVHVTENKTQKKVLLDFREILFAALFFFFFFYFYEIQIHRRYWKIRLAWSIHFKLLNISSQPKKKRTNAERRLKGNNQCDQMARLNVQYLSIFRNEN